MAGFDVSDIVAALHAARNEWRDSQKRTREPGSREFPSRDALASIVESLKGALFPMRLGPPDLRHESEDFYVGHTLDAALQSLLTQARLELRYNARHEPRDAAEIDAEATEAVRSFAAALPGIRRLLDGDVLAAFHGDPAARSVDEVLLCYPGVLAMVHHRLAHRLYGLGLPLLARIVAELAHGQTGIDIHPGARIDGGFFIDHGTGVVIGETAVIGKNVRIYQAVTLGAKRFPADAEGNLQKGLPRHPVVEDDVVIYAGATILGRVTLGRGATIGGNVWITDDVPPGASVTQASLQNAPQSRQTHFPNPGAFMSQTRIAVVVGSLRKDSFNRKLGLAIAHLAPSTFTFEHLRIDDLPLYNQDDDGNPSAAVKRLKSEIASAQGLLFITPEYNRSFPGVLKNAIDHGSRPYGQNAWAGKPAGVIGVSVGAIGTALAQQHLRNVLAYLDVPTLGQPEAFIQNKEGLFDDKGHIAESGKKFLQGWVDTYVAWVQRHTA